MLNLKITACHHARKETGHAQRRRKLRQEQFVKQQKFQQLEQKLKQKLLEQGLEQQFLQSEQQREPGDVLVRTQPRPQRRSTSEQRLYVKRRKPEKLR